MDRSCSDVARSTRSRVRFGHRVDKMENTPATLGEVGKGEGREWVTKDGINGDILEGNME